MEGPEVIHYPVPDTHPAMSLPCDPKTRLQDSKIKIGYLEEKDLREMSETLYEAFPDVWWDSHEDPATRPSKEIRIQRLAKRMKPSLRYPGFHFLKAYNADTGETMGYAGWHECTGKHKYPTTSAIHPGETFPDHFMPVAFRKDNFEALGWTEQEGWSKEEVEEMWSHVGPSWQKENAANDLARKNEMRDSKYWYLAPLAVKKEFRGRGVGKQLLQWAIDRADATNPPTPLILEALDNARPVYYHVGFKPTADNGPSKSYQLVRRISTNASS